jgi:hypothetical protein
MFVSYFSYNGHIILSAEILLFIIFQCVINRVKGNVIKSLAVKYRYFYQVLIFKSILHNAINMSFNIDR